MSAYHPRASRPHQGIADFDLGLVPGVALCGAVGAAGWLLQLGECALFGRAWLEALVLAILVGTALRFAWTPNARCNAGISFSARTLLEAAIVLLGASLSLPAVWAAGPALLAGIASIVAGSIAASFGLGRLCGLSARMAALVACGNAICGNSAIAAVAPVIGAEAGDVAASIAFTALLGVVLVVALPLLAAVLHLSALQSGALAGLTVYAVPQVLAAAAPMGALAVQFGTLVKLVRVLMLGPVVLTLSLAMGGRPRLAGLVPWFILGFLALACLRSAGLVPDALRPPMANLSNILTLLAMAALGLGTDLRAVAQAGPRVMLTTGCSLLGLGAAALVLIRVAGI